MTQKFNLDQYHKETLEPLSLTSPFTLRITEWKKYPPPVLVIKERREVAAAPTTIGDHKQQDLTLSVPSSYRLYDVSHISGESLRRILSIIRKILSQVRDEQGIPLELQRFMTQEGLKRRVNLPLNERAGAKLGLIFKLQMRVADLDRVELMARRISNFTREEAAYWLSRATTFGADENRWAQAGLKIMLGGQPGDKSIDKILTRLRESL